MIKGQMNGDVRFDWSGKGLVCEIVTRGRTGTGSRGLKFHWGGLIAFGADALFVFAPRTFEGEQFVIGLIGRFDTSHA
jgi:hypothetical protein